MLITEAKRLELLSNVFRKEYLASLCERGKIGIEEYLLSVNAMRAAENLSPLTVDDAARLPRRPLRSRRSKNPPTQA